MHRHAHYFIYKFDAPIDSLDDITEECSRDVNVVRRSLYKIQPPVFDQCTLEEELQPPAYRTEVQEMIEVTKRQEKKPFDSKAGITYYPFQR